MFPQLRDAEAWNIAVHTAADQILIKAELIRTQLAARAEITTAAVATAAAAAAIAITAAVTAHLFASADAAAAAISASHSATYNYLLNAAGAAEYAEYVRRQ